MSNPTRSGIGTVILWVIWPLAVLVAGFALIYKTELGSLLAGITTQFAWREITIIAIAAVLLASTIYINKPNQ